MQQERWPESDAAWVRRAEGVTRRSHSTSADGVLWHPLFIPIPYYSLEPCVLLPTKSISLC